MLTIKYGPITSTVEGDNKREKATAFRLLDKRLSVWVDGANFTPSFELGMWDGYARFFSKTSGKFSSGLLTRVVSLLLTEEMDFSLEDLPEPYTGWDSTGDIVLPNGMVMRDYQAESLRKTLKWYRGIWKVATNGGKTAMASGLIHSIGLDKRVLILVPRKVILSQFAEELKEKLCTKKVAVTGDGSFKLLDQGVTVCMYQTLSRRLKNKAVKTWLAGVDALLVDECHFAVAPTFSNIIQKCPAEFRIGMSGTPFKEEKHKRMEVRGLFGPVLTKVSNKTLIDRGISVKPHVIFLDVQNTKISNRKDEHGIMHKVDYQDAYAEGIRMNKNRNKVIEQLATGFVKSGRQTVILVRHTSHLNELKRLMPWAETAHGQSANKKELIAKLDSGEAFCLICTRILDTGLNTPNIEALINASGGKSEQEVLQSIGRTLRTSKTKEKDVWIVDFQDNHHRDLRRHGNQRMQLVVNQDAFDTTEFIHDMPPEVQHELSPSLLNSSHYATPVLDV